MSGRKILLLLAILAAGGLLEGAFALRGHFELGPSGCRVHPGRFEGPSHSFEERRELPFPAGGTLRLANAFGSVSVRGVAPAGQARVLLRKTVFAPDEARARETSVRLAVFEDLDAAVEWCEDALLAAHGRVPWEREELPLSKQELLHGLRFGSATRALLSAFARPADSLGTVHVVHVLSEGETREEAETQLRAFNAMAEEHSAEIVPVVREGNPANVILDYITEIDATGVITGRTGRSQFGRGLLGSTTMKLIQDAACPVVVQP